MTIRWISFAASWLATMALYAGVGLVAPASAREIVTGQVAPYPYRASLPVVREYQALLKKYAPHAEANYTSFEQFLGAKVVKALESLQSHDLGGITLSYSPTNRVGSRTVELTVIGANGRLMK